MSEHTPVPWYIQEDMLGGYYVNPEIEAGNDNIDDPSHDSCVFRCDTTLSGIDEDEQKANTRFILRAVNSHEVLLEGCKQAVHFIRDTPEYIYNRIGGSLARRLQAAIALAEKEG